LAGVQPGTVKRIRVVGLDYRAKGTVALGLHPWGGHQTSPCAINNGSYDVKHVLGTVDVEEDGSCCFECLSRVPVYFQMLDAKGRMVQNMRSWTMVLPGEAVSCIGCHEDKRNTYLDRYPATIASKKPPQRIKPFFAKGEEPVQEMDRFLSASEKRAMQYLGTNAPQAMDVPRGFSYTREIQPIWDQHCIQCHAGDKNPAKKDVPLSLLGDYRPITNPEIYGRTKWRLTRRIYGESTKGRLECALCRFVDGVELLGSAQSCHPFRFDALVRVPRPAIPGR
jgi:cytochrome c553